MLDVSDPAAWIAFDADVRGMSLRWDELGAGAGRVALDLCSYDGRVRQAALRRVSGYPELLPLVVIRCSDWAAPVREVARRLLRDVLPRLDAAELAALAPVLLRVGRRERGVFGVELLRDGVSGVAGERLVALLGHADPVVRRFACRIAVDEHVLPTGQLARTAALDSDVVVQNLCADAALAGIGEGRGSGAGTGTGTGAYLDVVSVLLGARNPRVRSAGVTALRRVGRAEAARAFLADRSALVRACARYVLRQGGADPLPVYQEWCADPGDAALPPGAAIGLAECGSRTDAALLLPLLAHSVPAVRARAVAGLRLLDVAGTERLRILMDDPAPAVAREASVALLSSARQLPTEWLTARIGPERPRHTRVAAFRLLCAQGGAAQLAAAAALLDDPDAKLRRRAEQITQGRRD
ncbi:hypothetical protein [Streptomyces sp. NPDC058268]|uniref:hypothetical protein n=1 Tax=Streptomyces sp. NPDC058268 TaxID=3346413 RepID=UPI0036E9DCC7